MSAVLRARACELWADGAASSAIADELGVHRVTVWRWTRTASRRLGELAASRLA